MSSNHERGFSFIEAMIASGIIVAALLAVAGMFAYSMRTNLYNEDLSTGIIVSNFVMEGIEARGWGATPNGGGLDPAAPVNGYFNYIGLAATGAIEMSTLDATLPFLAMWQVIGGNPQLITVSIFSQRSGVNQQPEELIRTTTEVSR